MICGLHFILRAEEGGASDRCQVGGNRDHFAVAETTANMCSVVQSQ